MNQTGVDPYMYGGFIPNFAEAQQKLVSEKLNVKDGDTIAAFPVVPLSKDFRLASVDAPENRQFGYEQAKNLLASRYSQASGIDLLNSNILANKAAYNRGVFDDPAIAKLLVESGLAVPDLRYTRDSELIRLTNVSKENKKGIWQYPDHPKVEQFEFQQARIKATKLGEEAYEQKPKIGETVLKNKTDFNRLTIKGGRRFFEPKSAECFIPNFAIPVDAARIPWFKKYASSYKNVASDKDVFRQIDFPTYGKGLDHNYAKVGNADMISFLYEDFVRSAMNIALGSKQVVRSKEAGFKNTPTNAISNRDPIDLAQKIGGANFRMLELKQSKNNQKQTISQIADAKLRGLFEENPELAKNVELMSIIFNDPKYFDPTGKSPDGFLNPFEQSIAPIVKNSYADVDPTMRGKLGLLTDGLMRRYQSKKNLFSKGFIPNFSDVIKFFRTQTGSKLFPEGGTGRC
jgi:endonuclease YncB( thermonuclease family)